MNEKYQNIQLEKTEQSFQVQVPPLIRLNCSVDDRLTFQHSFLGINSQEQPFCLRNAWNCFQLYCYQEEFWFIFYFKVYKKVTQFLPSCCGCILLHVSQRPSGHCWAVHRCCMVLDQCRSVVHLTSIQQMEIAPLACRQPKVTLCGRLHTTAKQYNRIRRVICCLLEDIIQNHTYSTKNAFSISKNHRTS